MDWLTRQSHRMVSQLLVIIVVLLYVVGCGDFYQRLLIPIQDTLIQCAAHVQSLVPPDSRIIVSTTSASSDQGVPNNYQEPQIFYYSRRYGWSLPADRHDTEKIIAYRNAGARYFVIYSGELLENNPLLKDYLKENSTQIGPGLDSGCAIYRFN